MRALAANAVRKQEVDRGEERVFTAEVLSVPEACSVLGVHRNTLYKLIQEGEIPAFRLIRGGRWKFRKKELEQWLEDRQARSNR